MGVSRMITINLEKAKGIKKDMLRADRKPLLDKLDIDYIKAIEQGQDTAEIVAEKQRLRDITKLTDTVTSVEELKSISV
jgi:hypothetical protein